MAAVFQSMKHLLAFLALALLGVVNTAAAMPPLPTIVSAGDSKDCDCCDAIGMAGCKDCCVAIAVDVPGVERGKPIDGMVESYPLLFFAAIAVAPALPPPRG